MHWWNWVIVVSAGIGHAALAVCVVNVVFGQPWPRWLLRCVRAAHDLWLVGGTPWLAWLLWRSGLLSDGRWAAVPTPLAVYLAVTAVIGLLVVPAVTARRLLRRQPAALVANHCRTVNVMERVGHRPAGTGPYGLMARLPGNEQFRLELVEKVLRLPHLPPAWNGLSLLHLSDLHFTGSVGKQYFHEVIELAGQLQCDLVALTGDLVDRPSCHDWVAELMGRLQAPHGCYAVLGNHDGWYEPERIRAALAAAGFQVLAGRCLRRQICGHWLAVGGTEVPWMGHMPQWPRTEPEAFRLLLSHSPDNVYWASRQGVDLMLSGHSHGGQVRLPLIGPVFMPSRYGRRFDAGLFQVGHTLLHVSRGVSGKHPLRWRCSPEVTRLVLCHSHESGKSPSPAFRRAR